MGEVWHDIINDYITARTNVIEQGLKIEGAMHNYLHTIGESEDFKLTFNHGTDIILECKGEIFSHDDLVGFCEVFGLTLIIQNKLTVYNHLENRVDIKTRYMFMIGRKEDEPLTGQGTD